MIFKFINLFRLNVFRYRFFCVCNLFILLFVFEGNDRYFRPCTKAHGEHDEAQAYIDIKAASVFQIHAPMFRIDKFGEGKSEQINLHVMSMTGKHKLDICFGQNIAFPVCGIVTEQNFEHSIGML